MKPFVVPDHVGLGQVQEPQGPRGAGRSRLKARTRPWLSSMIVWVSVAIGHERSHRENLVLLAKKPRGEAGVVDDGEDRFDRAARSGLHGGRVSRSSFHVTPCPPVDGLDASAGHHARVVGQGEGQLLLRAGVEGGRALRTSAVQVRSALAAPSRRSALGLRASTEMTTTVSATATRRPASGAPGAGARWPRPGSPRSGARWRRAGRASVVRRVRPGMRATPRRRRGPRDGLCDILEADVPARVPSAARTP